MNIFLIVDPTAGTKLASSNMYVRQPLAVLSCPICGTSLLVTTTQVVGTCVQLAVLVRHACMTEHDHLADPQSLVQWPMAC